MTEEYTIGEDEPTLEQRYATLQATADAMGCDLTITLVVGGIDLAETYRSLRTIPDEIETIAGQLDEIERLIADPRTATAAKAANRMNFTEACAKDILAKAKERQEEYRVALAAFDSISSDPPAGDDQDANVASMLAIVRDETTTDVLIRSALEGINANKAKRRAAAIAKKEGETE